MHETCACPDRELLRSYCIHIRQYPAEAAIDSCSLHVMGLSVLIRESKASDLLPSSLMHKLQIARHLIRHACVTFNLSTDA